MNVGIAVKRTIATKFDLIPGSIRGTRLTMSALGGSMRPRRGRMESKSVFISSCSRRELARRRPSRRLLWLQSNLAMLVLLVGVCAFIVGRLGL